MKRPVERLIVWTPRILCMCYAVFLGMFAADVFEEDAGFAETVLALLVHLIPSGVILAVLAISWRQEWLAAVVFAIAGILYLVWARQHLDWVLAICGPLWLIAILFFVSWLHRRKLRSGS